MNRFFQLFAVLILSVPLLAQTHTTPVLDEENHFSAIQDFDAGATVNGVPITGGAGSGPISVSGYTIPLTGTSYIPLSGSFNALVTTALNSVLGNTSTLFQNGTVNLDYPAGTPNPLASNQTLTVTLMDAGTEASPNFPGTATSYVCTVGNSKSTCNFVSSYTLPPMHNAYYQAVLCTASVCTSGGANMFLTNITVGSQVGSPITSDLPPVSSSTAGAELSNNGSTPSWLTMPVHSIKFSGADACARAVSADSAAYNTSTAPDVDMWDEISGTALACTANALASPFSGRLWLPAATLQLTCSGCTNSPSFIFGGSQEVYGSNIATNPLNGSILEAKQGAWPAGLGGNFCPGQASAGCGTYASPPAWSATPTYYWGNCVSNSGTNYCAIADSFSGAGHTPGTDWTNWTLMSSSTSPVLKGFADQRASVQNTRFHNISLDCQESGINITDGCTLYDNISAQENTVFDAMYLRRPTVWGIIEQDFTPNDGPYSGQLVYANSGATDDHGAKVDTTDSTNGSWQHNTISAASVSGTLMTLTLSGAPTNASAIYTNNLVDIINSCAALSPMASGDIDGNGSTHGFWQVHSVESTTVFTVTVPSGTSASGCNSGRADFFAGAINLNGNGNTTQNNRGFNSWTINASGVPKGTTTNFYDYPPLAIQTSTGNRPLRDFHVEGYRVSLCIACFNASDNQEVDNFWPNVNTHTGIIINPNGFGATRTDIRNYRANINGGGSTAAMVYTLIDYGNSNKLTLTNNPVITHYWLDAAGVAYFEGGNCTEMTNGWCMNATKGWQLYTAGVCQSGVSHC